MPCFVFLCSFRAGYRKSVCGVGASRELTLGILVEPMLILSLLVLALIADSTHIEMISNTLAMGWNSPLTTVLALLACGFACFIEMGKFPLMLLKQNRNYRKAR